MGLVFEAFPPEDKWGIHAMLSLPFTRHLPNMCSTYEYSYFVLYFAINWSGFDFRIITKELTL
jgi:hypothetical protein